MAEQFFCKALQKSEINESDYLLKNSIISHKLFPSLTTLNEINLKNGSSYSDEPHTGPQHR